MARSGDMPLLCAPLQVGTKAASLSSIAADGVNPHLATAVALELPAGEALRAGATNVVPIKEVHRAATFSVPGGRRLDATESTPDVSAQVLKGDLGDGGGAAAFGGGGTQVMSCQGSFIGGTTDMPRPCDPAPSAGCTITCSLPWCAPYSLWGGTGATCSSLGLLHSPGCDGP